MTVTKASIAVTDMHFANAITKKYFSRVTFSPRTTIKEAGKSFWKKFELTYAFPTIMFRNNFSTFQVESTNIAKYSTQTTQINASTFTPKEFTSLNAPSQTTVMLPNGEPAKPQAKSEPATQASTFNSALLSQQHSTHNRTSNSYYNQTSFLTRPTAKIRLLNTFGRGISQEGAKLQLKIPPAFTTQLINRLINREKSKETQTYVAAKAQNLIYYEPKAEFQVKTEDSVRQIVSTEYLNGQQPQATKNTTKQIGSGLLLNRAQENLFAPDINRLADRVCELIERKAKIERERRG